MSVPFSPSASVGPAPAASLILLRQEPEVEVLIGLRTLSTRAFPGATVFPGGKVEDQDRAWPGALDMLTAAKYAALRETFEETGVLITSRGEPPPVDATLAHSRAQVEAGAVKFADVLSLYGLEAALERLTPFAHWITPAYAPYRFDTLFFILEASPAEARASLICAEFEVLNWARPQDLLATGTTRLMTPTRHCLEVIAASETMVDAVNTARTRGLIDGYAARSAQPRS